MGKSPFQMAYGVRQGRIQPSGYTPTEGVYAFVLGDELECTDDFEVGDSIQISQSVDLTAIRLLRVDGKIRQPLMNAGRDISAQATLKRGGVVAAGDDLSALVAPVADLASTDHKAALEISGCVFPFNNCVNQIIGIVSPSTAILRYPVQNEVTGFTVQIVEVAWKFSMLINDAAELEVIPDSGDAWTTTDMAVNTRKLTGVQTVALRLSLVKR